MKCVVSGCPNRMVAPDRILNRPPKRFFSFPTEPATVKVWLAALRELDKQEEAEEHVICEDHFLPDDITGNGVKEDAIPIMPPDLDGGLGLSGSWGAAAEQEEEEEEEEEEQEEQEEQLSTTGVGRDDGGDPAPAVTDPPQQAPGPGSEPEAPAAGSSSSPEAQTTGSPPTSTTTDIAVLTRRFLDLLLAKPDGGLDLWRVAARLQAGWRPICDIINVLDAVHVIQRESVGRIRWIANAPVSSFLLRSEEKFQEELQRLKQVEDGLDALIRSCAQQLFDMTDDVTNAKLAYVTLDDLRRLRVLQEQTVMVVKAPEETKLEIPAPTEDRVQIHLKAEKAPILVLTCEVESEDATTSEPTQTGSRFFSTLEQSRIRTTPLDKDFMLLHSLDVSRASHSH